MFKKVWLYAHFMDITCFSIVFSNFLPQCFYAKCKSIVIGWRMQLFDIDDNVYTKYPLDFNSANYIPKVYYQAFPKQKCTFIGKNCNYSCQKKSSYCECCYTVADCIFVYVKNFTYKKHMALSSCSEIQFSLYTQSKEVNHVIFWHFHIIALSFEHFNKK